MWLSSCPFLLRFKRLTVAQNNYLLRFLSSTRWVALKLELMTNMVTLMVALFTFFGVSSAPYSYKAMAISLVLQVREGLSDGRWWPAVCGQTQGSMGL